ncbi:MAG: M24 family metallopeptidase, partial [Candidatus Marinimicrobia bacterium]|nr:M24 family metallopeptidase [Candidatus Neomarinimicrobiota bacterium]
MVRIRTKREIELIRESCQIVADTLSMLNEHIKPGVSTYDLDRMAEEFIILRGARPAFKGYMGFPASLCISIDDVVV